MSAAIWQMAAAVFLGTLPLLGVIVWNLIEVKTIRSELSAINQTLEERDRWTHPIVK